MTRPSLLVLAASLAAVGVGCAHCDTCDDFPAPCTGPNCGSPYQAAFPMEGGMIVEPIVGGPVGMAAGQIVPGSVVSSPATGAPSVVPPSPPPARSTEEGAAASPPISPPAGESGNGNRTGAGMPDLPLPPADSPFGGPVPN